MQQRQTGVAEPDMELLHPCQLPQLRRRGGEGEAPEPARGVGPAPMPDGTGAQQQAPAQIASEIAHRQEAVESRQPGHQAAQGLCELVDGRGFKLRHADTGTDQQGQRRHGDQPAELAGLAIRHRGLPEAAPVRPCARQEQLTISAAVAVGLQLLRGRQTSQVLLQPAELLGPLAVRRGELKGLLRRDLKRIRAAGGDALHLQMPCQRRDQGFR